LGSKKRRHYLERAGVNIFSAGPQNAIGAAMGRTGGDALG
jgi:hypothetical protein